MKTIFETQRLLIRSLTAADMEGFHDMQSNPRVMQFTTGKGMSREENEKELEMIIGAYSKPDNNFWVWAIERKSDGEFLGTGALVVNEEKENEIGFRFREKFWGKGYGREVTAGLIHYGIQTMGLKKIVAYVDKANLASVRILEQYMVFEKEFFNDAVQCIDRKYFRHAP